MVKSIFENQITYKDSTFYDASTWSLIHAYGLPFTEVKSSMVLAEKVNAVLANNSTPIFCCGEPLAIREAGTQNAFVETQLINSLFG